MITLAWVENEIEKALSEDATPRNVYDLAALVAVQGFLLKRAAPKEDEKPKETREEREHREAVLLTTHSADLDTIPTIEQIEDALGAVAVNTPEERKRVQDARTWGKIIRGSDN